MPINTIISGINSLYQTGVDIITNTLGGIPRIFNPEKNILDSYDVSTYHLKLYAAKFIGKDLNNVEPEYILAESGVTDIGIDDLKFKSIFGYTADTYTATTTVMTFTITESLGATFLDRVRIVANKLGEPNFVKMPFFIEITFMARDPETGNAMQIPHIPPIRYPIQIIKCEIKIDGSGSKYACQAVVAHSFAHSNEFGLNIKGLAIEASNLQEALTEVQKVYNDPLYRKELEANHSNNNEYSNNINETDPQNQNDVDPNQEIFGFNTFVEFNISKDFLIDDADALTFNPDDPLVEKTSTGDSYLTFDLSKNRIQINDNVAIHRMIDMLMTGTKYLQQNIKMQGRSENRFLEEYEFKPKQLYKVKSDVKILGYDPGQNEYIRKIRYDIVPFTAYHSLANRGEVQERELPVDFIGSLSGGISTSDDNTSDEITVSRSRAEVVKNYYYVFTGQNYHVINFDIAINFAWYMKLPRQYGDKISGMKNAVGAFMNNSPQHPSSEGRRDYEARINKAETIAPDLIDESEIQQISPNTTQQTNSTYIRRPANSEGLFPVTFMEYHGENDSDGGLQGNRNAARAQASTLLHSYIFNDNGADFVNIKIDIRGDPFWLLAWDSAPLYFTFKIGLPDEPGPDGLIKRVEDSLISGLFQVLTVDNVFVDGKFTQTISGVRDPQTRITGKIDGAQ